MQHKALTRLSLARVFMAGLAPSLSNQNTEREGGKTRGRVMEREEQGGRVGERVSLETEQEGKTNKREQGEEGKRKFRGRD